MPTTANFGWTTPADTDLVKDGASAIRTLGNGIDTSFLDLKGGTTNQILAKNSNTDLDFKWVSDATGMTNPMTTTGDTIYSSSGSTPARLGIGSTGQVLTVAGGVPSWATPSSGGMTLLSTTTLSGASTTLSAIDQTYNNLVLILKNTTNNTGNGITSIKPNGIANKVTQVLIERTNVNVVNGATAGDLSMAQGLSQLRTSTDNIFIITFYNYADTGAFKAIQANCYFVNSTNTTSLFINAAYIENTAISSLEIYNTGGNWSAGTALLYGVK